MIRGVRARWLVLPTLLVCFCVVTQASEWARWLGPNQDGTTSGDDLFALEQFDLKAAWSRPLGVAYSGIAIKDGRAVTLFADGEFDYVTAVDARTGKELWSYRIDTMYAAHDGSEGGPISMPVIDGDAVYGLGAKGHLFALRLQDGKELWALRIDDRFGARAPRYGFTTTPLVAGEVLFVQAGGDDGRSLIGFDKSTGERLWSTGDDKVSYESPILATLAGREQLVALTDTRVLGLSPRGQVLWSHEHGTVDEGDEGYASPVLLGEDRFLITGQQASKAFQLTKAGDGFEVEELWSSSALKGSTALPVLHDGRLYGFSDIFLTCVDPSNGEKVWKSRPPGGHGLILVDGHLVIFANDGSLVVAQASPEGYREKARLQVSERESYTYPSYAEGLIFVRNTRDFAAVAVSAAASTEQLVELAAARNAFERFVRELDAADDKRLLLDTFMAAQSGFPIVEDDRWVHFVYRGDAEDVAITGSMTEYLIEDPLEHVEGTDLYYRSYAIEPGARWEYRLNVDFENPQPDPLNPRRVPGMPDDLSEVVTAGWTAPDYLQPYRGDRPGRMESFTLASEILGNEREIDVYLPAGYDGSSQRYPLLLVENGKDWQANAHLVNTLNHRIGRDVAPVIVAFVQALHGAAARGEIGGERSADYVRMLAEELVPQVDGKYRTLAEPAARAVMGETANALMAVYAAAARPDVFGLAGGLSFYLPEPGRTQLLEAIDAKDGGAKARVWVVWNSNDLKRVDWDVDLARDSRSVAEALESNGYSVVTREVMDSAGWGSWRVRAGELLELMFPR